MEDQNSRGAIYRMPWGGGERTRVRDLDRFPLPGDLVAGRSAVFFHADERRETWALSLDDQHEELVSRGPSQVLLGAAARPFLLIRGPSTDEFRERGWLPWILSHGRIDEGPLPTDPELPEAVVGSLLGAGTLAGHPRLVEYEGDMYFYGQAYYALENERRHDKRGVLMRVAPDLSSVEVVRCIPPRPFDPRLPRGGEPSRIVDIAVSDEGIFVLRRTDGAESDLLDGRERPHAVKVWP